MNVVLLIGRLTADPELRYIQSTGKAVTSFSIAVDRGFKDAQGNKKVDFVKIQIWDKQAESCANYLEKGRLVAVRGSLEINTKEINGEKRQFAQVRADNVQFLEFKEKNAPTQQFAEPNSSPDGKYYTLGTDVDIPF